MSVKRRITAVICGLVFALFFAALYSVSADESVDRMIVPDCTGGFYRIGGDLHELTHIDGRGKTDRQYAVYFEVMQLVTSSGDVYAVGSTDSVTNIYDPVSGEIRMIGELDPKTNCIVITDNAEVYAVDAGRQNEVLHISENGERSVIYVSDGTIVMLLLDENSGSVYAVTDKGVTGLADGSSVRCAVPELPLKINAGYFCDSRGRVYTFSADHGFEKLANYSGSDAVCCTDEAVYILSDGRIIKEDFEGTLLGEYIPEPAPDDVIASGSSAAIVRASSLTILREKDFTAPDEPESHTDEPTQTSHEHSTSSKPEGKTSSVPESSRASENSKTKESSRASESSKTKENSKTNENSRTQTSKREQESSGNTGLSGSRYMIEDGIISDIPYDTTVAMIKSGIDYGGSIRFLNYKGKVLKSGKIGTGARLELTEGDGTVITYYLVVHGDLTGEGSFNSNDVRRALRAETGEELLDEYQRLAADVNHDGSFDIRDVNIICREYYQYGCSSGENAFLE